MSHFAHFGLSLIRGTGGALIGLPFELAVLAVEHGKQPKHARRLVGHDPGLPVRCGNGQGAAPGLTGRVVVQLEKGDNRKRGERELV